MKFRAALVPKWVTRALTTLFYPFFFPPVILAVLTALAVFDVWFFGFHGAAQSARELIYHPVLLLMVLGLVVVATVLHEIGHATACRYGGAEPGVMGAGIYLVWPAFYTDVTDAYRLGRVGRLRTDLGGVYFNGLFVLGIAGVYFLTGFEPLLVLVLVQHVQVVQQFLPFLRLDGYYILSDLTGVPDLFSRIKPVLASLIPWRQTHDRVRELKSWTRAVVVVYVLTLLPVMVFMFAVLVINAPRIFATAWDSAFVQYSQVNHAVEHGSVAVGVAAGVQMATLMLPAAGTAASIGRISKRVLDVPWKRTAGRPLGRAEFVLAVAAVAGWTASMWWPNGDYVPIRAHERGTVPEAVGQMWTLVRAFPSPTAKHRPTAPSAPTEPERPENPVLAPPTRPPTATGSTTSGSTQTTSTEVGTESSPSGTLETTTTDAETLTSTDATTTATPTVTTTVVDTSTIEDIPLPTTTGLPDLPTTTVTTPISTTAPTPETTTTP